MNQIDKELEILLSLDDKNYARCSVCQNFYHVRNTKDVMINMKMESNIFQYIRNRCLYCYSPIIRSRIKGVTPFSQEILEKCYHKEFIPFNNLVHWNRWRIDNYKEKFKEDSYGNIFM